MRQKPLISDWELEMTAEQSQTETEASAHPIYKLILLQIIGTLLYGNYLCIPLL